jgi:hypothetical protein
MRVIRTELYFDELEPKEYWLASSEGVANPGLGTAWFRGSFSDLANIQQHNVSDFRSIQLEEAHSFLAAAILGRSHLASWEDLSSTVHVSAALNAPIVIEQSPPTSIPLGTLLTKAPGIAIGTFIGLHAAGGASYLMFLTVPGGILVVSSAIGISKALEQGFNKAIARIMKRL